jgi:class 3 adenylate cyclase
MRSVPYERLAQRQGEEFFDIAVSPDDLERFAPSLIERPVVGGEVPSKADVFAVIFDLEGFTSFCSQREPHKIVPRFVREFRSWLFDEISTQLQQPRQELGDRRIGLAAPPPFFAKFLGDGFLFLWQSDFDIMKAELPAGCTDEEVENELGGDLSNIITVLVDVQRRYSNFYDESAEHYNNVPARLRCGAAVGAVCAIDSGIDYVGPCINQASRLQKLGSLSMAIDTVGLPRLDEDSILRKALHKERVAIRGASSTIALVHDDEWKAIGEQEQYRLRNG